jgi:hypothetical protein
MNCRASVQGPCDAHCAQAQFRFPAASAFRPLRFCQAFLSA